MRIVHIAAAAAITLAGTASAQIADPLSHAEQTLRSEEIGLGQGYPAVKGPAPKPQDFKPVTIAEINEPLNAANRKSYFRLSTVVDYDGDGVIDVARMERNGDQIAVIVERGGNRGSIVAWRADGPWPGGAEIAAAGRRRILVNFPESSMVVLSAESGRRMAYYIGD